MAPCFFCFGVWISARSREQIWIESWRGSLAEELSVFRQKKPSGEMSRFIQAISIFLLVVPARKGRHRRESSKLGSTCGLIKRPLSRAWIWNIDFRNWCVPSRTSSGVYVDLHAQLDRNGIEFPDYCPRWAMWWERVAKAVISIWWTPDISPPAASTQLPDILFFTAVDVSQRSFKL